MSKKLIITGITDCIKCPMRDESCNCDHPDADKSPHFKPKKYAPYETPMAGIPKWCPLEDE